jgi:lipoprotein-releasing system permease protein
LLGIALGVAALIVILSVMNGLELEFRNRLLSMTEHVSVSSEAGVAGWEAARNEVLALDGVLSVTPLVTVETMLSAGAELLPAVVRGIVPQQEVAVSDLEEIVGASVLRLLEPGARRLVLGRILALNLGVDVGDRVLVLDASFRNGRFAVDRTHFVVAGIFEAGVEQRDATVAFTHLADAGALLGLSGVPESLGVRLDDPMRAEPFKAEVEAALGPGFEYSSWVDENASLFRAMRIEKTMMTIILLFIAGVAAFNIVASLTMVVNEKERDIAILRTYGLEPRRVVRVFFVQGATIGVLGTLLGVALGLALAANVEIIVPWLETTFSFKIMPGDVFYITEIPSDIRLGDVVLIPSLALAMALVATIYPSRRAARVAPAQSLRYE